MSDRYTARLEIGGNVPKDLLDDLAQLLYEQGLEEFGSEEEVKKELVNCANSNEIPEFSDYEASWGEMSRVEKLLKEKGIPFTRVSRGSYESDPCILHFDGVKSKLTEMNSDEEAVIPASTIHHILTFCGEQEASGGIEDSIKLLDSKDSVEKHYAQLCMETGERPEALAFLKVHLEKYFPTTFSLPAFKVT
jgi:hypothetical protein